MKHHWGTDRPSPTRLRMIHSPKSSTGTPRPIPLAFLAHINFPPSSTDCTRTLIQRTMGHLLDGVVSSQLLISRSALRAGPGPGGRESRWPRSSEGADPPLEAGRLSRSEMASEGPAKASANGDRRTAVLRKTRQVRCRASVEPMQRLSRGRRPVRGSRPALPGCSPRASHTLCEGGCPQCVRRPQDVWRSPGWRAHGPRGYRSHAPWR